jgi:transposase
VEQDLGRVRARQPTPERARPLGRWVVDDLLDDITYTAGKIAKADARLRAATEGDKIVKKLLNQPGVGEVTAWVLRAYVGDFGRFKTAKQLARYCGLSPCNASSGTRTADAGLIDGCNRLLRATVVQAAHRLIRTTQRWRDLAASMRARGKPACVIAGAVGNRWLRTLHHAMKPDGGAGHARDGNDPTAGGGENPHGEA